MCPFPSTYIVLLVLYSWHLLMIQSYGRMIRLFSTLEAESTNNFIEECIVNKVKLFSHRKDAVWNGDWVGSYWGGGLYGNKMGKVLVPCDHRPQFNCFALISHLQVYGLIVGLLFSRLPIVFVFFFIPITYLSIALCRRLLYLLCSWRGRSMLAAAATNSLHTRRRRPR